MRKYKILLLLPLLSSAMMKDESKTTQKSNIFLTKPKTLCFDVCGYISEFIAAPKTLFSLICTNSSNFVYIFEGLISELLVDRKNNEASKIIEVLGKTLKILSKRNLLPPYIPIPLHVPSAVKEKFKKSSAKNNVYSSLCFDNEYIVLLPDASTDSKPLPVRILAKIDDLECSELLKLECIQQLLVENLKFLRNMNKDKILKQIKNFVSEFEYITEEMLANDSTENIKFKSPLQKERENNTCFIVQQDNIQAFERLWNSDTPDQQNTEQLQELVRIGRRKSTELVTFCENDPNLSVLILIENTTTVILPYLLKFPFFKIYTIVSPEIKTKDQLKISGIYNIQFTNWPSSHISDRFLAGCDDLRSVDLGQLNQVTCIGSSFLSGCDDLKSVDLGQLTQVTYIGSRFLSGCHKLTHIDLNSFTKVTSIESGFLCSCAELTSVNLSSLSQVTSIDDSFLCNCHKLVSINLNPLTQVTCIGSNFLSRCNQLTNVNLNSMNKVTKIKDNFLSECSQLKNINLSALSNVTQIEGIIIKDDVVLETGRGRAIYIISSFLNSSSGLTSLDLNPLSKMTNIRDTFLSNCSGLTSIDMSSLNQVTLIGSHFLAHCNGLTNLDLSSMKQITSIESYFFYSCKNLTNLDLSSLNQVTTIGACFLANCNKLTNVNLSGFERVTKIEKLPFSNEKYFLHGCIFLRRENINIRTLRKNNLVVKAINKIYSKKEHSKCCVLS